MWFTPNRFSGQRSHRLIEATSMPFRQRCNGSGLVFDEMQHAAIDAMSGPSEPRTGFYLCGSVGRGKTLLADEYFAAVPTKRKRRWHFHDFFRDVHDEMNASSVSVGDALRRLLGSTEVVLFDEFHVHDPADGIYLTAVLRTLFSSDVLLLATSNYAPTELMPNPRFHARFAPAIAMLTDRVELVNLGDGVDHRSVRPSTDGFASGTWTVWPIATCAPAEHKLVAAGQVVTALAVDAISVEFDFAELCERPLGSRQYLWLAEHFDTVTVRAVPDPAAIERDPLLRFCTLVDILHDRDVRPIIIAGAPPARILDAAQPPRDAARTVSRLATITR